ncbi:polymeric immunoglobulin receptor-like [Perca fluviatilis]|uniref:polymeric immunoglobulin receptor-like n=1 Tax=Perca fluviatilis TaxID=8168 RepID=UPI0019654445|nr:polymeric immunoglobulin receptor-like [Perca fluviatilis]
MAALILLLFLLSEASSDLIEVTVHPGDDVILSCQAADPTIRAVKWTRPDLEPDIVLYYSDGHLDPTHQHPSFKDRVELVDRDLKDRDASLILKNVSSIDNGTYECGLKTNDSGRTKRGNDSDPITIIRAIRLQVQDLPVVPVRPEGDVILPCQAADPFIRAVEWTRADLKTDNVLLYIDGHLNTTHQHPSYKGRVELVDRKLKDGNMSLILKNVNINDTGTYKCLVKTNDTDRIKTISTIRLQVKDLIVVTVDPGDDAILPCQAADSSIIVVDWTRPDLKPDDILYYRNEYLNTTHQHPDYKGRVELVVRDLKGKDVSLILKNVSRHDTGTYKCIVITRGSGHTKGDIDSYKIVTIRTIRLQVIDLNVVTVYPGDDVILPCQVANSSITAVEWTRPDLEPDIVLLYSDGHLDPTHQHPSFKDRVELVDRELKDGDVSLILKNVNINDTGTYECGVKTNCSACKMRDTNSDHIRIIRLQVPDLMVVTVRPGQDAILPCQAADSFIRAVKWTRPDLKPDIVLYYRDGHLDPTHQHPSFKDRVELVERELKDGDASLILKNVTINDNGTYECLVKTDGSTREKRGIEPIRTIYLQVPGSKKGNFLIYVAVAAGVGLFVAVVGVIYKICKKRRSGQPAAADEASADQLLDNS